MAPPILDLPPYQTSTYRDTANFGLIKKVIFGEPQPPLMPDAPYAAKVSNALPSAVLGTWEERGGC